MCKEYKARIKMVQVELNGTAKNEVFIGLEHKNCYLVWGIDLWWDKGILGVIFSRCGGMTKFSTGGATLHPPRREISTDLCEV